MEKEEVLGSVEFTRHLKREGTTIVTSTKLGFQPVGSDRFEISYPLTEIKSQRISPDTKSKVMLQIVTKSDALYNFLFVHKDGHEKQLEGRNLIKELLVQLIAKFNVKHLETFSFKKAFMHENKRVEQLYLDLVGSRLLSADEFWLKHADLTSDESLKKLQDVGISGAFLDGIERTSSDETERKFVIGTDFINSVFSTYPAVAKKHSEVVPRDMSDAEFWTKFFQSAYFKRQKTFDPDSIFGEAWKKDEKGFKKIATEPGHSKDIDLRVMDDVDIANEDGYGISTVKQPTLSEKEKLELRRKKLATGQELLSRFNQQSSMILKASMSRKTTLAETISGEKESDNKPTYGASSALLARPTEIDELQPQQIQSQAASQPTKFLPTSFSYPTAANYDKPETLKRPSLRVQDPDIIKKRTEIGQAVLQNLNWSNSQQCVIQNASISVMNSITDPKRDPTVGTIADIETFPSGLLEEFKNAYAALYEILRHFWACIPIPIGVEEEKVQVREKLVRIKKSLNKWRTDTLEVLSRKVQSEGKSLEVFIHMEDMIRVANDAYDEECRVYNEKKRKYESRE